MFFDDMVLYILRSGLHGQVEQTNAHPQHGIYDIITKGINRKSVLGFAFRTQGYPVL